MQSYESSHKKIAYRFILIVLSLSISTGLWISHISPALGYESSVYSGTPFISLLLILLPLFVCSVLTLFLLIQGGKTSSFNRYFILLAYICYVAFLGIIIIRNYYIWNASGDGGSHLGWILEIFNDGHFSNNNYPMIHTLTAQVSIVTGTDILKSFSIIPWLLVSLVPIFYFNLGLNLFKSEKVRIVLIILAILLVSRFTPFYAPNVMGNVLLVLYLSCILKNIKTPSIGSSTVAIIFTFSLVFVHPLILIIAIPFIIISNIVFNKNKAPIKTHSGILMISLVCFIFWLSYTFLLQQKIENILDTIFYNAPGSGSQYLEIASMAIYYGYDLFIFILTNYSSFIILLLLSLICILKYNSKRSCDYHLNSFALMALVSIGILALGFFIDFGFGFTRTINYITIFCMPFVAFLFYKIIIEYKYNNIFPLLLPLFVLFMLFISSIIVIYPSEYTKESNYQNTQSEITGFHWLLNNGNDEYDLSSAGFGTFRLSSFLFYDREGDKWQISHNLNMPPHHFGYNENLSLSSYYENETYLMINEKFRMLYKTVFPEIADIRYEDVDYYKLNLDYKLNNIYSNSGFDIWLIM